jgi:hypothetical protein
MGVSHKSVGKGLSCPGNGPPLTWSSDGQVTASLEPGGIKSTMGT